jgi:hypothetical protein
MRAMPVETLAMVPTLRAFRKQSRLKAISC